MLSRLRRKRDETRYLVCLLHYILLDQIYQFELTCSSSSSGVVKMAISKAERLDRKRKAELQRQKRIFQDPKLLAKLNEKRRARYAENKKKSKGKKIPRKLLEEKRRKWRDQKRNQKAKKMLIESANVSTPHSVEKTLNFHDSTTGTPSFVKDSSLPASNSTRADTMRKENRRRAEVKRLIQKNKVKQLNAKIKNLERNNNMYRQRYYRLKDSLITKSNSPRSKMARELKGTSIPREVRKKLLFTTSVAADLLDLYASTKSYKKKKILTDNLHFTSDM